MPDRLKPAKPEALPPFAAAAVRVWHLMGNTIDWPALPIVAEVVGVDDIPLLVEHLEELRAIQRERQESEREH